MPRLSKTVVTYSDPFNGTTNPKGIPGALKTYTVSASNLGLIPVDLDTTVIIDPIPANAELVVADIGGAGSGPVVFTQGVPTSTLTYTFTSLASTTDDVSFSDDGGATYVYTPVPNADGTDPNVTHLRVAPKGSFAAKTGPGDPSFTLGFRMRVQ